MAHLTVETRRRFVRLVNRISALLEEDERGEVNIGYAYPSFYSFFTWLWAKRPEDLLKK